MAMWRATIGAKPVIVNREDDDWDTDPDFVVSFDLLLGFSVS